MYTIYFTFQLSELLNLEEVESMRHLFYFGKKRIGCPFSSGFPFLIRNKFLFSYQEEEEKFQASIWPEEMYFIPIHDKKYSGPINKIIVRSSSDILRK